MRDHINSGGHTRVTKFELLKYASRTGFYAAPFILCLMLVADLVIYASSVRAMNELSRDVARKIAENRLPEGLVPRKIEARMFFGARQVRVDTVPGREMTVDFSLSSKEASMFGLLPFVLGDRLTVRSTVVRHPGAIPAVFGQ